MITVKGRTETCIVVKKSRFLGLVCRVDSEDDAQQLLDERKKLHRDARHHCFAYVLESGAMRYSDDGEPQGTAGLPMLEVLKRSGLTDVLVICTRYFGGTLLGAPGLVRAYTQSASQTLDAAARVQLVSCSVFGCTFDFPVWARVQTPLTQMGCMMDDIDYTEKVHVKIRIVQENEKLFLDQVKNLTLGQTIPVRLESAMMERDV